MLGFKPLPPEVVKAVDPQVQILDSLWMLVLFILISSWITEPFEIAARDDQQELRSLL